MLFIADSFDATCIVSKHRKEPETPYIWHPNLLASSKQVDVDDALWLCSLLLVRADTGGEFVYCHVRIELDFITLNKDVKAVQISIISR